MNKKAKSQEWARERIRSAGLRATPARIATLKLLQNSESPLTHAEVSDALHNLEIDKATVFRNLNDLVSKKYFAAQRSVIMFGDLKSFKTPMNMIHTHILFVSIVGL